MTHDLLSRFAERRTGIEIRRALRSDHRLDVSAQDADLVSVASSAGIVESGTDPDCDPRVKAIGFDSPMSWAVAWIDGTATASDPDFAGASTESETDPFAEHRTGIELDRLLHFGHWIPINKGWSGAYAREHFPGWDWNSFIEVCRAADIVERNAGGGPLRCRSEVAALHFNGPDDLLVETVTGR